MRCGSVRHASMLPAPPRRNSSPPPHAHRPARGPGPRPPRSMGDRGRVEVSPGRGPGRASPGRGVQGGAKAPLADGSRESGISLAVMHRRTGALAGRGSMPRSGQFQSLAETVPNARTRLRDCRGGSAGDGTSPRQGARGITTHTLCSVLSPFFPNSFILQRLINRLQISTDPCGCRRITPGRHDAEAVPRGLTGLRNQPECGGAARIGRWALTASKTCEEFQREGRGTVTVRRYSDGSSWNGHDKPTRGFAAGNREMGKFCPDARDLCGVANSLRPPEPTPVRWKSSERACHASTAFRLSRIVQTRPL